MVSRPCILRADRQLWGQVNPNDVSLANITAGDPDLIEVNEAFASQALCVTCLESL